MERAEKVPPSVPRTEENGAIRADLLRSALPACQPQEGSPANTFTDAEIEELQAKFPEIQIRPRTSGSAAKEERFDILETWKAPPTKSAVHEVIENVPTTLDWHDAPDFSLPKLDATKAFRDQVRSGAFTGPTNAVCPGFLQCNLVVLPQGPEAFDFLLFCQRNPKSCPLIDVCDVGSPHPYAVAAGADLRTDVPKYAIYRNGKLEQEVSI